MKLRTFIYLLTLLAVLSCGLFDEVDREGRLTKIEVKPGNTAILKGSKQQFEAKVFGSDLPENQKVSWEVRGHQSSTAITQDGLLSIATTETATELTVTATSTKDRNIKGTATVSVIDITRPDPIVTNVIVYPNVVNLSKGEYHQMSATVLGLNNPPQDVRWSISNTSNGSAIDQTGSLHIGENETASTLVVTATSTANSSISGNSIIYISETGNPNAIVTDVIVSPNSVNVPRGDTCQFNALVLGINNPSQYVVWSVSGGNSSTSINNVGLLTVSQNETAQYLTVTAKSVANQEVSGNAYVSVPTTGNVWEVDSQNAWNIAINGIRNAGGDKTHLININGDISIPPRPQNENLFLYLTGLTVVIDGTGSISLSQNGALMQIGLAQTVIVRNISLIGRESNTHPLVRVEESGVFRLEAGATITNNICQGEAGGVSVRGGTFIMNHSIIRNCRAINAGAVFVSAGSFIMQENSKLRENQTNTMTTLSSGAVFVANTGVFTLDWGSIEHNTCGRGAGGVLVNGGFFYLNNGYIAFNTSNGQNGGGVNIQNNGTFCMYNGLINGNIANNGFGGGVYVHLGSFSKTGGTITGIDIPAPNGNASSNAGNAAYHRNYPNSLWRNATAGTSDSTSDFGFWLCEND
ncbi:MAG: Ig-like domain-containing protein [Candidatus Cloacimonetes bacterium]|nr:Ig-like domain-containing protein [Candidatus Cloacimonadota bacterium]